MKLTKAHLAHAIDFTNHYKSIIDEPIATREAKSLRKQYPTIMEPILPRDMFAGACHHERKHAPIGFSPEPGGMGYYCNEFVIRDYLRDEDVPPDVQKRVGEVNAVLVL